MKEKLSSEYIMDGWLKYHGKSVKWLIENEPELIKSPDWYKKYAVTQEQHDEWYEWAVSELGKNLRMPKTRVKRYFSFDYLNLSPSIKKIS
jgi:hypothetical protein